MEGTEVKGTVFGK